MRYSAPLITNPYDNVLWRLADRDFDGRHHACARPSQVLLLLLHDGLYAIPKQLPNDVFQMGEDVRERSVQVPGQFQGGEQGGGPVGCGGERFNGVETRGDYFFGVAFQEDFADELVGGADMGGVGEVPGRIERFG